MKKGVFIIKYILYYYHNGGIFVKKLQSILMAAIMLLTVASLLVMPALADDSVNLVTNGNFEATEGWTLDKNHSVCAEAGKSGNGLLIDYEVAGSGVAYTEIADLEVGKTYIFSFDVKVVTDIEGMGLRYMMREGGNGALVGAINSFITGEAGEWTNVSTSFTVAEFQSEAVPQLMFYYMPPTSAGEVYIDNVSIVEKIAPPAKTGNLVENWDLENETNEKWAFLSDAEITALTEGEGESATTNKVIKLKGNTEAQPAAYQELTGFKPNTEYTVSVSVKSDAVDPLTASGSDKGIRVRVDYNKFLTTAAFYPMYTNTAPSNKWKEMETTFTTSENVTSESVLVLSMYLNEATGTVYADEIIIEEKEEVIIDSSKIVMNGDFEADEGWTIADNHNVCAEAGRSGKGLLLDYATAGTAMSYATLNGLEAGKKYTLSFDAKIVTATKGSGLRYIIREGAAGSLVGSVTKFVTGDAADWTTVSILFDVAEFQSEDVPQLQFYFMAPTSEGKIYIDNVSITEKKLPPAKTGNMVGNWDLENETNNEWALLGAEIAALTEGEGASATTNNTLKLTGNADAQPAAYQEMTGFKPNTKYNISIAIKSDATDVFTATGSDKGIRLRVDYNKRLTTAAFYPLYTGAAETDTWKRIGVSFTTADTVTTESILVLSLFLTDATGTIYVDDISVEEAQTDSSNLALNGSFEEVTNVGWPGSWTNTGGGENPGKTVFFDNTDPYDGSWCVKFDCAANNTINADAAASIKQRLCLMQGINVTAGKTYRISYAAKVESGCSSVAIFMRQMGNAAPGFLNGGVTLPEANKWYEVVLYYTPTASGTAKILVGSYNAHNGSGAFYVDAFRMEEVTDARVDFVNADKNSNELRVIETPEADSKIAAFAGLPKTTDTATLVTAVYVKDNDTLRLKSVSLSSTTHTNTVCASALLATEAVDIPEDAYMVKTFLWSADKKTPLGNSNLVLFEQDEITE